MSEDATPTAESLFESAEAEGALSGASMQVLGAVPNIGATIQEALGTPADEVEASEVVLLTTEVDDSNSIPSAGNTDLVIAGHNGVIDAVVDSKQQDNILMSTRYLNEGILSPFGPVESTTRMDQGNYHPQYGTPLYDQTVVTLGTVTAKTQEFQDLGVPVRTVTVLITDGADVGSLHHGPADVKAIVDDMLRLENHIIVAMGIDDGYTNHREVFEAMGILPSWILTPDNTESDIRKAFQVVSKSVVQASQSTAAEFSQLGGFGSTASV